MIWKSNAPSTCQCDTPTISVVICAYTEDRWDLLGAALQSIFSQQFAAHEIIVVVDHNPALYRRVKLAFCDITVIENRNARGLSGARNSGISAARGDIVAFIDEDAQASQHWLAQLSECYRDQRVIGVGGAIEPNWQNGRPGWFPDEFDWVVGCTYRGMPRSLQPIRNLIGCNMSFRREALVRAGGFRIGRIGKLSIGQENDETELCIRIKTLWTHSILIYEPGAKVSHFVPAERKSWVYFGLRCYSEGLSKARLAEIAGVGPALSSERVHLFVALPRALLSSVWESLSGPSVWPLVRATAIVVGAGCTALGFLLGQVMGRMRPPVLMTRDRI